MLDREIATELATFVVALVWVTASPRSADHGSERQSVRRVAERLRNAPSDAEHRHLQDLTTTIDQNASLWIGVASSQRHKALSAVRNVLPALDPDPRRLASANLDPRRIAFLVVECARAAAPTDFAEATSDPPERANLNIHVLRTLILRTLEHLQRVALREWTERHLEDRLSLSVADAASSMELRPDPSNEGIAEYQPADLLTDKLASMLAAELSNIGHAASALETPLPSADEDLETSIKEVLNVQLNRSETGFSAPSPLPDAIETQEVSIASETAPAGSPDAPLSRASETTLTGEMRPELAASPSEAQAPLASIERPSNLDLITDQPTSALSAELDGGHVATALDTPLTLAEVDLETEIQKALGDLLNKREPGSPTPSPLPDSMETSGVSVAREAITAGLPTPPEGLVAVTTIQCGLNWRLHQTRPKRVNLPTGPASVHASVGGT